MTKFSPIFALLVLLLVVHYFNTSRIADIDVHQTLLLDSEISVAISPIPVVPEEELTVAVRLINKQLSGQIHQLDAWVEGVNMFMGKSPVIWQQDPEQTAAEKDLYIGSFMLGSCSEPQMQWQLILVMQLKSGEKLQRVLQFSSQMSAS